MNAMTNEQKTLLGLLGKYLFEAPYEPLANTDWEAVIKESQLQTVFSVAFSRYQELPLSEETSHKVKTSLMKHTLANLSCFKNHSYLHNLMLKHNISYCVLKGAVSASYYPEPLYRSMGDVDFYLHPHDLDRAASVLQEEGFVFDEGNHLYHIAMHHGKKDIEMHFKPIAYQEGWIGEILEEYWRDIRETSILCENELATFYRPSVFHHGFILLTHLQQHLFQEGVGLRHFCDWALFVKSLTQDEFTALFEKKLKRIGLFRLAQLLSLAAVKHLGLAYQNWMGDDYEFADELLLDIICGGNFGRKDRKRAYEALFIGKGDGQARYKSRIGQAFASLNRLTDYHWKAAKKFPLLYPVGWVFFSLRYLFRVMTGKRKIHLIDNFKKSGERKKKYEKIKAYDPEDE